MTKKRKRRNMWTIFAFIAFGATALYAALAIFLREFRGVIIPIHWFLPGASLFAAFMTTGALKEGRFVGDFDESTKEKNPIGFWLRLMFGYAFAGAIAALFVHQLLK